MSQPLQPSAESLSHAKTRIDALRHTLATVIIGQTALIDRLLIGLFTGGHLLLEGLPGLAKTLAVRCLAQAMHLKFQRVQFTPDLLPADLIGTQIYNPRTGEMSIKTGPIFASILFADEINRAPAKVQSALLEAMEERQVTISETTFPLPSPFLVLATQNPIEQEGTYPLPEAQLDRFLLKIRVEYPTRAEESQILDRMGTLSPATSVAPIWTLEDVLQFRALVDAVYVAEPLKEYLLDLVQATRHPERHAPQLVGMLRLGASPRATLSLLRAAKAMAILQGRGYVTPGDLKAIAPDVLRHRLIPSYEADAQGCTVDDLIVRLLAAVPVP
ncbi:AAA family ATPase [Tuwongella immobilis]|uniref:AAA+ ATPase domain-containing protein n=1 Tax=Tuwongella immobilis TaxID=692036 RepID=A0A6C2YSA8_9BACT|nr:MoxR family ATPase [Tuwongella immobilis]VIP04550.1 atpase aaa : ATPase associated with various cellular activities AAA_3 OS=Coraliomargarita akajimensis (strain DSM 45221 / IAM 15411 / JCM 23193 / KCTC 12865) GN=Caka_0776 PE=4 SV=1: AAA_3 [Tuwongella immobilis]VTS06461.1 atpase aaa : ATPase associated with various cellular activities AAA_3 OS=Coraliomargarita akajimensis (strain DSM 45221 / IAM 15411 / JCM 23193 / KCTC 12865) GN=Caka_0776 PE=4 SV=1: AAA_3 [Tuwongella immobilis]